MKPVEETRRERLKLLAKRAGSIASLSEQLGKDRTDTAALNRVINSIQRKERDGKIYTMGSTMARDIEEKLALPLGWMDTPLTYAELMGDDDPRSKALAVFEALPDYQIDTALRLLAALAESKKSTGTGGQ